MFKPIAPLAEYLMYEDYISEFLCINRNTPKVNCNGKCYLMQRLSQEKENKKEGVPRIAMEEYPIGIMNVAQFPFAEVPEKGAEIQEHPAITYCFLFMNGTFRPPIMVA